MKVGRRTYDLMYRTWAPWDAVGVREDLRRRVVAPAVPGVMALDVGCGTGANAVYLATLGYHVVGVDFSAVALARARERAGAAGVDDRCRFLEADLTAPGLLADHTGRFEVLVDASTVDDLDAAGRRVVADHLGRLARPGARLLMWCFYADRSALPPISFTGPSRLSAGLEPGEESMLLGRDFEVVEVAGDGHHQAVIELRRRS